MLHSSPSSQTETLPRKKLSVEHQVCIIVWKVSMLAPSRTEWIMASMAKRARSGSRV